MSSDQPPEFKSGTYMHYKGDLYVVPEMPPVLDTEIEDRWLIIYRKLGESAFFGRPADMFKEKVRDVEGKLVERFVRIGDLPDPLELE